MAGADYVLAVPEMRTADREGGLIAVCMATFDPDPALLGRQLDSLQAQTDRSWVCVMSDDCSSPEYFAAIEAEVQGDYRFVVSRSEERLGFYPNFERRCGWPRPRESSSLSATRTTTGAREVRHSVRGDRRSALAYSDTRLIDASGRVLSETIWPGRAMNRSSVASTLIAHGVPGAAALYQREVVELAPSAV
jgi:hypothetical protein